MILGGISGVPQKGGDVCSTFYTAHIYWSRQRHSSQIQYVLLRCSCTCLCGFDFSASRTRISCLLATHPRTALKGPGCNWQIFSHKTQAQKKDSEKNIMVRSTMRGVVSILSDLHIGKQVSSFSILEGTRNASWCSPKTAKGASAR